MVDATIDIFLALIAACIKLAEFLLWGLSQDLLTGIVTCELALLSVIAYVAIASEIRAYNRRGFKDFFGGVRLPTPSAENASVCEPVIVLVHGTWSQSAAWTEEKSTLRTMIAHRMEVKTGLKPHFEKFVWTGRNSLNSRHEASTKLRQKLNEISNASPSATVVVIAHSHGGNIVLCALDESYGSQNVAGVVCMNTPFIQFRFRKFPKSFRIGMALAVGIFSFLTFQMVCRFLGHQPTLMETGLAMSIPTSLFLSFESTSTERVAKTIEMAAAPKGITSESLLIVRHAGDEAASLLGFVNLVSALVMRIALIPSYWLDRMTHISDKMGRQFASPKRISELFFILTTFLLVLFAVVKPIQAVLPAETAVFLGVLMILGFIASMFFDPVLGSTIGYVSAGLMIALLAPFVIFPLILFGWEITRVAIGMHVSAEPSPPGTWAISQFPTTLEMPDKMSLLKLILGNEVDQPKSEPLSHSVIYEDENALRTVADFIVAKISVRLS